MSGIKQTNHIGCENVGQRIPNVSSTRKNCNVLFEKNIESFKYDCNIYVSPMQIFRIAQNLNYINC